MRIDFATLAFGYKVLAGGATPNWATSLGQGKEYKINDDPEIDEMLKGLVYSSVSLSSLSTKIGKGGRMVSGDAPNSPILLGALFSKVYINDTLIEDGKFILLITRDTSESHAGRLRLKYGPGNTCESGGHTYSNQDFFQHTRRQLGLSEDACWFVSSINIVNQNELVLRTIIVDAESTVTYSDSAALHSAWDKLISELEGTPLEMPEPDDNSNEYLSPNWFSEQAEKLLSVDIEAKQLYDDFKEKFGPDALKRYSGVDLLRKIFLSEQVDKECLCYTLEYNKQYDLFGGISGATAYKYGLFYSGSRKSWVTGSGKKPRLLTEEQAIELGTTIRDELCNGAATIATYGELNDLSDYMSLYSKLLPIMPNTLGKMWVMKYFHMIFPDLFPTFYSETWQNNVLGKLNIEPNDNGFIRMGQIALFVKKCGISNVAFSKVIYSIGTTDTDESEDGEAVVVPVTYNTGFNSKYGRNRIIFGAPGTGKSFTLKKETEGFAEPENTERVTFHPDYTYANFVGTYKPIPSKDADGKPTITYKYVPGPFMRVYVNALRNSRTETPKPFLLIIEEINRANVAAVFGDVFQLLDRDDDYVSEYPIAATEDMRRYLAEALDGENGNPDSYTFLKIPDNMFIWATMNSADQGVFPMDTAFKRRWEFTYMGINEGESGIVGKKVSLGQGAYQQEIEWNELRKAINKVLYSYKINEDKLLGPYFLSKRIFDDSNEIDEVVFKEMFKSKVLMYLFDDAAKQKRDSLFSGIEAPRTYSALCEAFDKKGISVFCPEIISQFGAKTEE